MRILVLGGSGFIGSHLAEALQERGHRIRIFDRAPTGSAQWAHRVEFRSGNFLDSPELAEALQGVDLVYHLISTTVPSTSNLDPIADINGNLVATVQLLQHMVRLNVKRIVFLSSGGTVYGNPTIEPVPEGHPLAPLCSYGIVKVAIENYLHMFQQLHGIEPIVLRASNPFGPRQRHTGVQGVIPTFLDRVRNGKRVQIWGDGSIVRDYIYISDLVDLCITAGLSHETGVFNAGSGVGHSLNQLRALIERVSGQQLLVDFFPARPFDVRRITLDMSRTRSVLGWSAKTKIEDGISRHWEWLNAQP